MNLPKILAMTSIIGGLALTGCGQYEFEHVYADLPFSMEKVHRPQIPDHKVLLTDFGAVGDGVTLNTDAFRDAVDSLVSVGGGHLIVPEGIWLTGPVTLKDNIDLHVTPEAVIRFSPQRDLYPIVETVFEGLDTRRCQSPVNAYGARNISITGKADAERRPLWFVKNLCRRKPV